jgi:hypothetical protein
VQSGGNPAKVRLQDLLFAIRKDRPKYNRAKELLACDRLIRKYRKSAAPEIATKLGRPTGDDDSDAPAVASSAAPAVAAASTGNKPSALVGGSGKPQTGVGANAKVVAFA